MKHIIRQILLVGNSLVNQILVAYTSRVSANGGTTEATGCVTTKLQAIDNKSLLNTATFALIPSGVKASNIYAELPNSGNGDLSFTRATTATRVNSSGVIESVASGVPRIDYSLGGCPNLLLEPQRTNLVPSANTYLTATNITYDSSITDSPISGQNATKITKTDTGVIRYPWQSILASLPSGSTAYTISRFFKYNGFDINTSLEPNNSTQWGGTGWKQLITINSSGVTLSTSTLCTSTITAFPNGWYRVCVTITTGTTPSGGTPVQCLMAMAGSLAENSSFLTACPQLEVGSYATSYIPTTSGAATRNAESFTRSSVYMNGLIGASGGTWFIELKNNLGLTRDNTNRVLCLGDSSSGTGSYQLYMYNSSGTGRLTLYKNNAGAGATSVFATTSDNIKLVIAWNSATNLLNVYQNGVKVVTDNVFTVDNAVHPMEYLVSPSGGGGVPAYISQMALWNTPLSDAQCQSLTT